MNLLAWNLCFAAVLSAQVSPLTPTINKGGVANAAQSVGTSKVAPGQICSVYGTIFSGNTESAASVPLPKTLAGSSVLVNNLPAPLLYVSPGQINFQIPTEVVVGSSIEIRVFNGALPSDPVMLEVVTAQPGVYSLLGTTTVIAVDAVTFIPAPIVVDRLKGSYVAVFGSGFGATIPATPSGNVGTGTCATSVTAMLDRVAVPVSCSLISFVGEYQLNIFLSPETLVGEHNIVLATAGQTVAFPIQTK